MRAQAWQAHPASLLLEDTGAKDSKSTRPACRTTGLQWLNHAMLFTTNTPAPTHGCFLDDQPRVQSGIFSPNPFLFPESSSRLMAGSLTWVPSWPPEGQPSILSSVSHQSPGHGPSTPFSQPQVQSCSAEGSSTGAGAGVVMGWCSG